MFSLIDTQLLLWLNSLVPTSHLGAKLFYFPSDNAIVRGAPVIFPLFALWFGSECWKRRSRLLVGIGAACVATLLSVWIQSNIYVHTRPFLDSGFHLRGAEVVPSTGWDHLSSFPSDTSTLYFALATILFFERKRTGAFAFVWSFLISGLVRCAVGWHYPSDVLGSIILGPGMVIIFRQFRSLQLWTGNALRCMEPRIFVVHAILFIVLADASYLFPAGQQFVHGLKDVALFLIGH
jgi:undecaprenyl-diphosphatase